MSHGPDAWCYDALKTRSFRYGDFAQVTVLRTLDVEWMHFVNHASTFATFVDGVQPLEELLDGEPKVPTPPDVLAAVRAYVLAVRTPGCSTWVEAELTLAGAVDVSAMLLTWFSASLNGRAINDCELPGPPESGVYGDSPLSSIAARLRVLVAPGRASMRFQCSASETRHSTSYHGDLSLELDVPAHRLMPVPLVFDTHALRVA